MDNRMPWSMFVQNINEIKEFSDEITDGWEIFGSPKEENIYLRKRTTRIYTQNGLLNKEELLSDSSEAKVFFYDFHIVYNNSYGVPVLCFNMWNSDGRLLTMEEAWEYFHPYYSNENMYAVLTQNDHPVLLTPILMLHPCRTVDVMRIFLKTSNNPIVSWLSISGPAVNLLISNKYEKLTRKK